MPVNMSISLEVHNIKAIHYLDGDDVKRQEVLVATKKFLTDESLLNDDMIIAFIGQEGYLATYSTCPVSISNADTRIPEVTKRWEEMAYSVLGPACKPLVDVK